MSPRAWVSALILIALTAAVGAGVIIAAILIRSPQ
jgi:hypothetical protein